MLIIYPAWPKTVVQIPVSFGFDLALFESLSEIVVSTELLSSRRHPSVTRTMTHKRLHGLKPSPYILWTVSLRSTSRCSFLRIWKNICILALLDSCQQSSWKLKFVRPVYFSQNDPLLENGWPWSEKKCNLRLGGVIADCIGVPLTLWYSSSFCYHSVHLSDYVL